MSNSGTLGLAGCYNGGNTRDTMPTPPPSVADHQRQLENEAKIRQEGLQREAAQKLREDNKRQREQLEDAARRERAQARRRCPRLPSAACACSGRSRGSRRSSPCSAWRPRDRWRPLPFKSREPRRDGRVSATAPRWVVKGEM